MGIPYIQLDTDFLHGTAKVAAALLGLRRREVIGMAADLIAFAVNETSTKDSPPDGCFVDPDATTILEAAMEWDGEHGRAVTAFERAGLLEKLEIGYRVRGCDRYRATWEKNNRRRTGAKPEPMSPVTGANGPGNRTEPARNRPLDGDGDGEVEEQKKKEASASPPPLKPAFDFLKAADQLRSETFPSALQDAPDSGRLIAWWKQAASTVPPDTLLNAYKAFLGDPWASGLSPPAPWAAWQSQWKRFIPGQDGRARTTAPKKRAANGF